MKYEILKEVTIWDTEYNVPNHTYLIAGSDKIIAYLNAVNNTVVQLKNKMRIDKRYRKFEKVNNSELAKLIPKDNPEVIEKDIRVFNVASKDHNYVVKYNEKSGKITCDCTGFKYRGKCKHIEAVKGKL